jgi:hypothetical protein
MTPERNDSMDLLRDSSLLDEARMLNVFARWSIGLIGLYHPIRKAGFTSAAALVASRGELPNEHT